MLRLRPFEEYMFMDDRKLYPMSFFIRVRFSGALDEHALQSAFDKAVSLHPLLNSVVVELKKGRYYWSPSEKKPSVHRFETTDLESLPHTPRIDLTVEPGVRLYVVSRRFGEALKTELLFQAHHACTDGLGMTRLIKEVLRFYALETGNVDESLRPLPPDSRTLKKRGKHALTFRYLLELCRIIPMQVVGLYAFLRTYVVTPTSLVPMSRDQYLPHLSDAFPAIVCRTLDGEAFAGLRAAARQNGVTLNDLLMRDLFLALGRFREKYFAEKTHRNIRLSVPVDLRPHATETEHVANIVSMIFVDRVVPKDEPSENLLRSLNREMNRNKFCRSALTLNWVLAFCQRIPGLLAVGVHRERRVWATGVFSNLGRPLHDSPLSETDGRIRIGDVMLEGIDVAPPVRAWTAVALGVASYAGALSLTLHYDTQFISREQAEEIQDKLFEYLAKSGSETNELRPGVADGG